MTESYKVRETLIKCSEKQSNTMPSMLTPWKKTDIEQKEADLMVREIKEQSRYNKAADNLIGYTTLKLKVLQVAAQELLDTWKANEDTGEDTRLAQAVDSLAKAMKQTAVGHNK